MTEAKPQPETTPQPEPQPAAQVEPETRHDRVAAGESAPVTETRKRAWVLPTVIVAGALALLIALSASFVGGMLVGSRFGGDSDGRGNPGSHHADDRADRMPRFELREDRAPFGDRGPGRDMPGPGMPGTETPSPETR